MGSTVSDDDGKEPPPEGAIPISFPRGLKELTGREFVTLVVMVAVVSFGLALLFLNELLR